MNLATRFSRINWLRLVALASLAVLLGPVILLLYEGLGPLRNPIGYSYGFFLSIWLTIFTSALAALVSIILFTPLSYYLARSKNKIAESLTDLPAIIPHPVVGIAVLVFASPLTPFGRFLVAHGIVLFDSILGIVVALSIVSAPIYVNSLHPFFESMNAAHENYAQSLGASRFRAFVSVVLPSSRNAILNASLISMSRAMSEFGSLAIIAYYVAQPPYLGFFGVSPASVSIYNFYTLYGPGGAITGSAILILISILMLVILRSIRR